MIIAIGLKMHKVSLSNNLGQNRQLQGIGMV